MRVSTCHCAVGAVVCECLRATVPWVPSCASVCVPLCRCARVSACHCRFGCLNSLVLFGATRVYPAAFRGADLLARPLARTSTWMFPLRFAINIFAPLKLLWRLCGQMLVPPQSLHLCVSEFVGGWRGIERSEWRWWACDNQTKVSYTILSTCACVSVCVL